MNLDNAVVPCGNGDDHIECCLTKDMGKIPCRAIVSKKVPECKHIVHVKCSKKVGKDFKCTSPCAAILSCGQYDKEDADGKPAKHPACRKICGAQYPDSDHTCKRPCHKGMNCGSCFWPCEVRFLNFG